MPPDAQYICSSCRFSIPGCRQGLGTVNGATRLHSDLCNLQLCYGGVYEGARGTRGICAFVEMAGALTSTIVAIGWPADSNSSRADRKWSTRMLSALLPVHIASVCAWRNGYEVVETTECSYAMS